MARQDAGHVALVLPVGVVRLQQAQFQVHLLVRVQQVEPVDVCLGVVGQLHGEVDLRLAHLAPFGRDDDDSVGGTRAIDGRGGRVLQHRDALDVLRVDAGDGCLIDVVNVLQLLHRGDFGAFEGNAVEHPKRVLCAVHGRHAADAQLDGCARRAAGRDAGQSGNLSGQCLVDAVDAADDLIGHLHRGDGRSQLAAVNLLVTGHDQLVHLLGRIFHIDRVVRLPVLEAQRHCGVAHETAGELPVGRRDFQPELAVEVGRGPRSHLALRGHDGHRGTDNGEVVRLVEDYPRDGTRLCRHGQQADQPQHKGGFNSSHHSSLSFFHSCFFISPIRARSGCARSNLRNGSAWASRKRSVFPSASSGLSPVPRASR